MRCHSKGFTAPGLARRAIAVAVLVVIALAAIPVLALAQTRDVTTTAVVTFTDKTMRNSPGGLLEAKATDAVALALQDSREFLVTAARDVELELRNLGISPPLSNSQAVRLGRRLDVDSVAVGDVLAASVDDRTGKASVRMELRLIDVAAEEALDGAVADISTSGLPGWRGMEADALNEALRQAADTVVDSMLSTRVRRGTVEMVLPSGVCEIGLGSQDGVKRGMKMVVMRPIYIRDLEKVAMRKLGRIDVGEVQADICYAHAQTGVAPRTGDYALRVYEPLTQVNIARKKSDRTQLVAGAVALALLASFVAIGTGGNISTQAPVPISYIHQSAMGSTPVIRVEFTNNVKAWGHLLFRGHSAGFPADAPYLVEVSSGLGGEQSIKIIDDVPTAAASRDVTITINFRDEDGDPDTEDVDLTFSHPALVPGTTYFHAVRKVTEPNYPVGANPPLSQTGGVDGVTQDPTNAIAAGSQFPMVSEATKVVGPVTYVLAAQLVSPPDNAPPQNTNSLTFEWNPTTGADEYMVEVFPASDPNGLQQPIFRRQGIRPRGAASLTETWTPATGDLQANTFYHWRVGARRSVELGGGKAGQGIPRVGFGSNEITGYVLSSMRSFLTAPIPPQPVGSTEGVQDPGLVAGVPRDIVTPVAEPTAPKPVASPKPGRSRAGADRGPKLGGTRPRIGVSTRLPGQ